MQYTNIYSSTLKWYDKHKRDLPWRRSTNIYRVWLSEVMLQQTQVKTVIPYYINWLKNFKSVEDVAYADIDVLLKAWEGLGYYSRCRNFHQACKIVVEKYGGKIPRTYGEFITLPGVGSYIASAVLSIACNTKLPAIDVNLKRVYARMLGLKNDTKRNSMRIHQYGFNLVQGARPGDFNQAVMDIGSQICHPSRPLCNFCPNKTYCKAYASKKPYLYALKKKDKKTKTKKMIAALITIDGKCIIEKRDNAGLLGGLWEFPTIETSATVPEHINTLFQNRFSKQITLIEKMGSVKHSYSHFKVDVDFYLFSGSQKLKSDKSFKWINIEEFDSYAFSKVNHKLKSIINDD